MKHSNNANAVRLLLALGVVFAHVQLALDIPQSSFPWVACFLVLSGYLVLASRESSRSTGHFLWKRVLRIWPAMLIAFGLAVFCNGFTPYTAKMILGTLLLTPPGGHSFWTIGLEESLYLVLAACYAAGLYKSAIAAWGGLMLSVLVAWLIEPHADGGWRYLMNLVPMFFVGNLLFLYRDRIVWRWWIALVLVVAYAVVVNNFGFGGILHTIITEGCIAYPILWVSIYAKDVSSWIAKPGDVSYNLFLFHGAALPVIVLMSGVRSFWPLLGVVLLSVLPLCFLSANTVEAKALEYKNRPPRLHFWKAKRAETVEAAA